VLCGFPGVFKSICKLFSQVCVCVCVDDITSCTQGQNTLQKFCWRPVLEAVVFDVVTRPRRPDRSTVSAQSSQLLWVPNVQQHRFQMTQINALTFDPTRNGLNCCLDTETVDLRIGNCCLNRIGGYESNQISNRIRV